MFKYNTDYKIQVNAVVQHSEIKLICRKGKYYA